MTDGKRGGAADAETSGIGASAAPGREWRMTAGRKRDAVLRVLRGEPLEIVARELAVTAADLSGWRDVFLEAGAASLKARERDDRDETIDRLQSKLGEVLMDNELLYAKVGRLEAGSGGAPFGGAEVEAMSAVVSNSTCHPYGVARACRVWGVARAGIYRGRRVIAPLTPRRRPGPQGPMPDAALVEAIRQVLIASPFHGEGYRKVWARLRHAGLCTSKERVRRLMRENGLSAATRTGSPRGPRNHDGTIIPETINAMWGTDMTTAFTIEHGQVAVFVAVDHCSAECVGIHAALRGTRHEALEPVRQGVVERFGRVEMDAANGLSIRHDHGSQYVSHDFQKEIAWLGASSSPAFVRAPEGNGCAERFIRTLKENLLWVRTFHTVEELRLALIDFRQTYNEHWLIQRHGHRSPAQFRRDQMDTMPLAA
ncbi:MAG: IS3 family transposase [Cryobacterium sp.]|nr:IS3 family transposase [Cryobacterium sp.]